MDKIQKKSLPSYFDIQGHRGCRGLLPENSLPAFLKALELGVTTLEMDLVISQDFQVVVSHEPYFSHEISLTSEKKTISADKEINYNIFKMNYEEVKKYDCGSKIHPGFSKQKKIPVFKPLFLEVVDLGEKFIQSRNLKSIQYNIEIKSTPDGDNIFHPVPEVFSDLVYNAVKEKNIEKRTLLQCFDQRTLKYFHQQYPSVKLSLLIENNISPEENLKNLGFTPDVYSPDYTLVDKDLISFAKEVNMKVIPWTVNSADEIKKLIDFGVDGVITDSADLFE